MLKLLKKEFSLAMHPVTPIMIILSAMVIIPNYPYSVIFFYVSMSLFFTCLLGRENKDIIYSLNLPVSKSSIVKARFMFAVLIQLLQLTVMVPLVVLSQKVNPSGNQAGMDAGISLFAVGFIVYGLFNLIFFSGYYKDVNKVGVAFVKSSIMIFVCVTIEVASTYVVPVVRDVLDTADPNHLSSKLIFLGVGILIYIVLTALTCKLSINRFEKLDLN